MIWIVFSAMVLAVLTILVAPLFRARAAVPARAAYDLIVYKDQLAEVERDLDRGVLTADQADSARIEIKRRMLAASESAKEAGKAVGKRGGLIALAAFLAVAVSGLSFGLYSLLGSPNLPDQPYSARAAKIQAMQGQMAKIRSMVDNLAQRLQKNPNDGRGWAMLGRSLRVLGQSEKARDAYAKALPLLPGDEQVRMEYASLLIEDLPSGSMLPPAFVTVMREVMAIDDKNPDALYFVGLAEAQAGHSATARELWTKLLNGMPADSPDRAEITKQINALPK